MADTSGFLGLEREGRVRDLHVSSQEIREEFVDPEEGRAERFWTPKTGAFSPAGR
jgi:hypothetical protein